MIENMLRELLKSLNPLLIEDSCNKNYSDEDREIAKKISLNPLLIEDSCNTMIKGHVKVEYF